MKRTFAVIDMKAFYAFVECVDRKLDPFKTPLVVCDTSRGEGTIVLSVSPYLKAMGVPSRCRKRELPKIEGLIYAVPRMATYVEKSAKVVSIVLDFFGEDDIHVYSIDELFVDLTPYLKMYECTPRQLVMKVQKRILDETGLVATAGIGDNMLMAKLALDLDGKKRAPYIAIWTKEDIPNKLWKVTPLSKMWGISQGYEKKLNNLGIFTVGQLANSSKLLLKQKFGVIGEQLWEHANGIDETNIREKYIPEENSFSLGQIMHEDYTKEEALILLREMNDDLSNRLRFHKQQTETVSLSIRYTYDDLEGGFSHQSKLALPTDDSEILFNELKILFDKYIGDHLIRGIYISYGQLTSDKPVQMSLFDSDEKQIERAEMQKAMDKIKKRFGQDAVLRGSSLLEKSTAKERHNQIGGHRK